MVVSSWLNLTRSFHAAAHGPILAGLELSNASSPYAVLETGVGPAAHVGHVGNMAPRRHEAFTRHRPTNLVSMHGATQDLVPSRSAFITLLICVHVAAVLFWLYMVFVNRRLAATAPKQAAPRKVSVSYDWASLPGDLRSMSLARVKVGGHVGGHVGSHVHTTGHATAAEQRGQSLAARGTKSASATGLGKDVRMALRLNKLSEGAPVTFSERSPRSPEPHSMT